MEAAEQWIHLIPGERRDAILLKAQQDKDEGNLDIPVALSLPGNAEEEADLHYVVLLLPDGQSLQATGTYSLAIFGFLGIILLFSIPPSSALDPKTGTQDRNLSSSTGNIRVPSSTQGTFTKQSPTADQKFSLIFSKLAALEQTVATLQNQNTAQAQHIAQLQQIISFQSGGTVTIQAPGTLELSAGGTLKIAGSMIDIKAPITGVHGILQADTMMTTNVIAQMYTPGAGNIW